VTDIENFACSCFSKFAAFFAKLRHPEIAATVAYQHGPSYRYCASSGRSITANESASGTVLIGLHWLVKQTRDDIFVYNKDSRKIRGDTPAIRLNTIENWLELPNPQSNAISVKVRCWSFIISLARLMRCASK
jgi:hypothetical protein